MGEAARRDAVGALARLLLLLAQRRVADRAAGGDLEVMRALRAVLRQAIREPLRGRRRRGVTARRCHIPGVTGRAGEASRGITSRA